MEETKTTLPQKDKEKDNKIASTILLRNFMAFLPQNMVRKILLNPHRKVLEETEWFEGVILFSDISGFTAMSQTLSNYGSRGIEEMSRILNTYLTQMSKIIYERNGILQKIAGDALTVLFEKSANVQWKVPIQNAIDCSFEMQDLITKFKKIKTIAPEPFVLAMKIGISSGRLFMGTLGSYNFGIEPFLIGQPIDYAVLSEHNAEQGEIWIHKDSFQRVEDYVKVIFDKNDYKRITRKYNAIKQKEDNQSNFVVKLLADDKQRIINEIRNCVPPSIAKRIELGYQDFLGENRKTTIVFINFDGITIEEQDFEKKLKKYYNTMQKIITQYQGTLYEFESGDKGFKIIAIFGSPISTEDDENAAVFCADAILKAGKEINWIKSQRIGITTGFVFAGVIGAPLLRRYAVIGDKVNLSARLMSVAEPNSILIDEETYSAVKDTFKWEKLPPRDIKGKEGKVQTYLFKGINLPEEKKTAKELPYLIGREEESRRLITGFNKVTKKEGQIVSIIGEMGVGKRSLIKGFLEFARKEGASTYEAICYNYGIQIPYFGWIQLFKEVFGINEDDENSHKIEKVTNFIKEYLPTEINKIPLLFQFLGLEAENNEWSKHLDASVKKTNLLNLLISCLLNISQNRCIVIALNDIHWGNNSTLDFLYQLSKSIKKESIMIVISYRPFTTQLPESLSETKNLEYHSNIILSELSSEQCLDFIRYKWNVRNIPPNFKEALKRNIGGNPYYIEVLMSSLIDSNHLLFDEKTDSYYFSDDLSKITIPPTIQTLVVSQIDRLDETSKLLLKVASVIGISFNVEILKLIFPIEISISNLMSNLEYLCEQGLLEKEEKGGETLFTFRNELTLETVYMNLPFSQRKHLHEYAASTIETIYKTKLESYYDILSFHYRKTDNTEKKLMYLKLAGTKAKNTYANKEAVSYFVEVADILEKELKDKVEIPEKDWESIANDLFDIFIELSDINRFMGEMSYSKDWLEKAETTVVKMNDENRRYTLLRSFGEWFEFSDLYQPALEYYLRAYNCIKKMNDTQRASLSSGHLGNLYRTIGKYEKAEARYKEAAELANKFGDIVSEGRWLGNIGIIKANQGKYDEALEYYEKALDISRKENDKSREAAWLSLIATVYVAQAKYGLALKFGYDSLEVTNAIGYKRSAVLTLNTIGNTYRFMGKYNESLDAHHQALEIARNIGAINQEVICRGEIGEIYRFQERWDEALEFYKKAYNIAKSLGDTYNQALWERAIGIVYYQSPNPQVKKAKQHLRSAMELARSIGHKKLKAEAQIHFGNAIAVDGELDEAENMIKRGLQTAQNIGHPGLTIWGRRMLGIIFIKQGRKNEGTKELLFALKENEKLGLTKDIAECCLELGHELKDKTYLERALNLFKELNLDTRVKQVEQYLSLINP